MLTAEAMGAGWQVESQFVAPGEQPVDAPSALYSLAPGVAERVSDLESPPGLFAVVIRRPADPVVLSTAGLIVVADRVGEPGNLGTIIRSAEAAGADAVVVTPGTVDETNPKVVRASAGALFHVPVVAATLADVAADRLAPDRVVVAPWDAPHVCRVERADRHRGWQRSVGARRRGADR